MTLTLEYTEIMDMIQKHLGETVTLIGEPKFIMPRINKNKPKIMIEFMPRSNLDSNSVTPPPTMEAPTHTPETIEPEMDYSDLAHQQVDEVYEQPLSGNAFGAKPEKVVVTPDDAFVSSGSAPAVNDADTSSLNTISYGSQY